MYSPQFVEAARGRTLPTKRSIDHLNLGQRWRAQTVNLHQFTLARRSPQYRAIMDRATWLSADGWPIVILLRSHGFLVERVTGSEWLERMVESGQLASYKIGLIGGSVDTGDRLQDLLGTSLVLREHGSQTDWSPGHLADELRLREVQVLLVAVTPPYGDTVAQQVQDAGYAGSVLAVGGAVDMLVGAQASAPPWVRRLNVEWVYRLVHAPRRLARRYLIDCAPTFLIDILPTVIAARFRRAFSMKLATRPAQPSRRTRARQ